MSIRHRDYLGRFEFYNCMKLDQIACKAIMEEAVNIIQLAAVLSSRVGYCNDPYSQTEEIYKNFDPEDSQYIS
ncbi:hypothetical protein A2U01_0062427, partial [Trifolium medium]|nr:hypothetical protein [Trifolium medium]